MEALPPTSSVCICFLEEDGFECEQVFLPTEETMCAGFNPILANIENYDDMDEPSRNQKRKHIRWKKLFHSLIPSKRHHRGVKKKRENAKFKDLDTSDTSTNTASTCSDVSYANLEGFIIKTSKISKEDYGEAIDPNIEDILSEFVDKAQFLGGKGDDLGFDEATVCTVQSESSSLSSHSNISKGEPSLMERRLLNTGVVARSDFNFVTDRVSKEVVHLAGAKKNEYHLTQDKNVSHVKTGIWEVTCLEDDGTPQPPYYIVTGVSMDDRVDTSKLRKSVFAGQRHTRRPKLALAPTEIAEGLTGYKSGTMAPICHTENMKFFLEESLVSDVDCETHKLNVGSGTFGLCLSLSAKHFLEIAKSNPKGLEICPIIRETNE